MKALTNSLRMRGTAKRGMLPDPALYLFLFRGRGQDMRPARSLAQRERSLLAKLGTTKDVTSVVSELLV